MIHILSNQTSLSDIFLSELRDIGIQNDRMRFRTNIERLGTVMAYEISKTLQYHIKEIKTPLAKTNVQSIQDELVIATILRAGMPFMQGFLKMFDHAEAAFVGASRGVHHADHSFDINLGYVACPELNHKTLIVCDPMLASGKSLVEAIQALRVNGQPRKIHIACVIASPDGVQYIQEHLPEAELWLAALDEKLNTDSYIVPGLGDAGDLSFGEKL